MLPLIESEGTIYYNNNNFAEDALQTLKNAGCNTIRIRLWHTPTVNQSGFNEVKTFAQRVKNSGMKVWLTVHYSDTWADPGHQEKPSAWNGLTFNQLKTFLSVKRDALLIKGLVFTFLNFFFEPGLIMINEWRVSCNYVVEKDSKSPIVDSFCVLTPLSSLRSTIHVKTCNSPHSDSLWLRFILLFLFFSQVIHIEIYQWIV